MMTTKIINRSQRPELRDAEHAVKEFLSHDRFSLTRFSTGLCHYVYEVRPENG